METKGSRGRSTQAAPAWRRLQRPAHLQSQGPPSGGEEAPVTRPSGGHTTMKMRTM